MYASLTIAADSKRTDADVAAIGGQRQDYSEGAEIASFRRLFRQRRLIAHTQGRSTWDYLAHTGDTAYCEGQRIVMRESAVREGLAVVEKLAGATVDDAK